MFDNQFNIMSDAIQGGLAQEQSDCFRELTILFKYESDCRVQQIGSEKMSCLRFHEPGCLI